MASYSIPIAVPPASGAFGPSLSLSYDSGAGLTEVGMGWRVAGTVKIRRRTEDGLPAFDGRDAFEIVGLGIPCELLEVTPGVFRPRYEDGSLVRATRSANGAEWEVRTKSGAILRLGGAGFTENEGKQVAAYLLREQLDRNGHRIAYSWDRSEGHALLTGVVWNAFDAAARNEVRFAYESRPDPHRGFSAGISESITRRLASIEVIHGEELVRRYELAYSDGIHPVLTQLTLVGRDGATTLPPARFDYTEAKLEVSADQVVTMQSPPGQSPASADVALADMNGDGLPDLLVGKAGKYRTYENHDGTRWLAPEDWASSASPSVSLGDPGIQLADVDADGAPDLVVKSGKSALRYFPRPMGTHFDAPVDVETVPSFTFEDPDVRLADLDGDRRMDAIVTTPSGIAIGYNRGGQSWTEPELVGRVDASQDLRFSDGHTQLCDVNGDRVMDFCYLRSGAMTYWLGRGRGRFESAAEASGVPAYDVAAPYALDDLNGDGWADLVRVGVDRVSYALATAEGEFGDLRTIEGTPTKGPTTSAHFADMNGSGTTDVVWVDTTSDDSASWKYLELFPDGRAGLLRRIDNGLGKVQTIAYEPAALGATRARDAENPWTTRMNIAMPVVSRVTVSSSLGDPDQVSEFTYRDGSYDSLERTFAGFGSGKRVDFGDEWTPALVTESTFDTGLEHRVLRGAPLTSESRNEAGTVFNRSTIEYRAKSLATAIDGRSVEYSSKTSVLTEIFEGSRVTPDARRTFTEFVEDDYGNVVEERRWGEVRGSDFLVGNDEALVTRTFANDPDEWLLGFVTTEELTDAAGRRVTMNRKYYDGSPFTGLALGKVARGLVSREEAWVGPAEDAFELVIGTKYDGDGLPVETRDARGGGHVFEWADDHTSIRAEHVKLADGKELVERAEVDAAFGNLTSVREYNGQITRYEYDALGRLTSVIRPGDSRSAPTTRYSYLASAPLSRVITEARVSGDDSTVETTESLYDGLGRARGALAKDGKRWILAGVSLLDARGHARRTLLPRAVDTAAHDAPPLFDTKPTGTDTWRDATGRELRTRSPSGIESRTEYAPFAVRHWDGGQNDPASPYEHTPTTRRMDGLGRTIAHEQTLGGKPFAATYAYDPAGNPLSRTDPEGAIARYEYDGRGRRTVLRDPDAGEHRFTYDATSNLIAHQHPDGKTARFVFDLAGRALSEDSDGDGTPETTRTWDEDTSSQGKLVRITGPSGEIRHEYDERGRTVATTLNIDGTSYTTRSEFDDQDREVLHVYPDGSSIEIRRNARGQINGYGNALALDYGEDGLESERRFSSGVIVTSGYDDDRRRVDLHMRAPGGETVEHLHWTYDSAGNLTRIDDQRPVIPKGEDRSESYVHDNLYRLVGVKGPWGTESWRFSPSGSLLQRDSSVPGQSLQSLRYEARPHAPTAVDGREIAYDARGRMTNDGERTYTWNDADELVRVSSANGTVDNTYDGDGTRRVRLERDASGKETTTHFVDAWTDVRDGALVRYIVHGGQRVARLGTKSGVAGASLLAIGALLGGRAPGDSGALVIATLLLIVLAARLAKYLVAAARQRRHVPLLCAGVASLLALGACATGESINAASPRSSTPGSVHVLTDEDTLLTTDLLGSLLGETNPSGKSTGRFASYPFGAARMDSSAETQKYATAPRDGVGLDAMGARFYAPDLGIWTSPDPLAVTSPERLVTEDFAAANPYAYAKDSPLLNADRDGHFWHIAAGAAFGALVGGAIEAGHQYLDTGRVNDWGRVAAAAAGGAVSGAIIAANPTAGIGSLMMSGAIAGAADGVTRRLVESGGKSAGTVKEFVSDAAAGAITAGVLKGGAALAKAAIRRAPAVVRCVTNALGRSTAATASGSGQAAKSATVDLYRAVGVNEFKSVMATNKFLPGGASLEARQFALTMDEAMTYANADVSKVAILKATIRREALPSFDFSKAIDPHIFKNGVVSVQHGAQSGNFS